MIAIDSNTVNLAYKQQEQIVCVSDIEYIEANEWLSIICTADSNIVCAKRLKQLISIFEKYGFIRCHKGYIVNMNKIDRMTSTKIILISGKDIPLGRTYKSIVRSAFEKYNT